MDHSGPDGDKLSKYSSDLGTGGAGRGGELHEGPTCAELAGQVAARQPRDQSLRAAGQQMVLRRSKIGRPAAGDPPEPARGREQDDDKDGAYRKPGTSGGGQRLKRTRNDTRVHCHAGPPMMPPEPIAPRLPGPVDRGQLVTRGTPSRKKG